MGKILVLFLFVVLVLSLIVSLAAISYVSAESLNLQIIRDKMIWDLPELSGFTYAGEWHIQQDTIPYTHIDLRYISPEDNDQHSEFALNIYDNTLPDSFLDSEANQHRSVYRNISLINLNGNKIYVGIEENGLLSFYFWISGNNFIRGWGGNDIGSIYDIPLFNNLTEKYLEKYPSTYGCEGGDCINKEVKEQIKCVFDDSTQLQKCYTAEQNSRAYCSGIDTCITDISGYKGEKITWKSTCGGYAYTIMDGNEEYVKFSCDNVLNESCQPSKCDDGTIPECKIDNGQCICKTCPPIIIKPVCGNGICESGEGEICSAVAMSCEIGKECKAPPSECFVVCPQDCKQIEGIYANLNEKFKLQVYQPVKITENENHLMKITFKDLILSQCGEIEVSSEAAETIESKVAIATGMVVAPTEITESPTTTTPTEILKCIGAGPTALLDVDMIVNSQISTSTMLNLNLGEKKQIGDFTILFVSYDYASRTGTFLVTREKFSCPERCKCDENGNVIECAVEACKGGETLCPDGVCRDKCSIISEDCKYGCMYDGKCFPMGVRSSGMYCGTELFMSSQKASDEKCDNNFECKSNVCVDGECISGSLIKKILDWFKRLFGGE